MKEERWSENGGRFVIVAGDVTWGRNIRTQKMRTVLARRTSNVESIYIYGKGLLRRDIELTQTSGGKKRGFLYEKRVSSGEEGGG